MEGGASIAASSCGVSLLPLGQGGGGGGGLARPFIDARRSGGEVSDGDFSRFLKTTRALSAPR